MKQQVSTWVALTLVMLLTVLAATIIFLLQGRYILLRRVSDGALAQATLSAQVAAQEVTLAAAQVVNANALATVDSAEAAQLNMAAELAAARNQAATTEADRAAAQATLTALGLDQETGPTIIIFAPQDGARVEPETPFDILVTVTDLRGIAAVKLDINGKTVGNFNPAEEAVFTFKQTWTPGAQQTVDIEVTAVNVLGRAGVRQRVTVSTTDQPDVNAAVRARILTAVEDIRGLQAKTPITPTLLSRADYTERLQKEFEADLDRTEIANTTLALYALNFVPRDFDLYATYLSLYSAGVAGFYDSETNEFVVISDDQTLSVAEQVTHAHEFVHALQDQYFNLDELDSQDLDSEASAALRALAEGEARFVENVYITQYLNRAELAQLFQESADSDTAALSEVPQFMLDDLLFSYTDGLDFVTALYDADGFDAIDNAWADPPLSTEQILHPARYLAGDAPQLVTLAPLTSTLGTGWRRVEDEILGEFYLREYLAQELSAGIVERAATGWGGDRLAVYYRDRPDGIVMALRLAWDIQADSQEFVDAYEQYAGRMYNTPGQNLDSGTMCWQGADITCLARGADGDVLVVRAPDETLARRVLTANDF